MGVTCRLNYPGTRRTTKQLNNNLNLYQVFTTGTHGKYRGWVVADSFTSSVSLSQCPRSRTPQPWGGLSVLLSASSGFPFWTCCLFALPQQCSALLQVTLFLLFSFPSLLHLEDLVTTGVFLRGWGNPKEKPPGRGAN